MQIAINRFKKNKIAVGFACFLAAVFLGNFINNKICRNQYRRILKRMKLLYTVSECKKLKSSIGVLALQGIASTTGQFLYLKSSSDKQQYSKQMMSTQIKLRDQNDYSVLPLITSINETKVEVNSFNFEKVYQYVRSPPQNAKFFSKLLWHLKNLFSQKSYKENLQGIKNNQYVVVKGEIIKDFVQKHFKVSQMSHSPYYFYEQIEGLMRSCWWKMSVDIAVISILIGTTIFHLFQDSDLELNIFRKQQIPGQSYINDPQLCQLCVTEVKNTLFFPCLHLASCDKCYENIKEKKDQCPFCRAEITDIKYLKIDQNY